MFACPAHLLANAHHDAGAIGTLHGRPNGPGHRQGASVTKWRLRCWSWRTSPLGRKLSVHGYRSGRVTPFSISTTPRQARPEDPPWVYPPPAAPKNLADGRFVLPAGNVERCLPVAVASIDSGTARQEHCDDLSVAASNRPMQRRRPLASRAFALEGLRHRIDERSAYAVLERNRRCSLKAVEAEDGAAIR